LFSTGEIADRTDFFRSLLDEHTAKVGHYGPQTALTVKEQAITLVREKGETYFTAFWANRSNIT
jgi:hypothetical protein